MILNITSYPRSGNSFFTTTLLQFGTTWKCKRGDVTFKPVARVYSSAGVHSKVYGIESVPWHDGGRGASGEDKNPVRYINDHESVYLYKRHDVPNDYVGPRIYLVRDGRDVLYSYAHHNVVNKLIVSHKKAGNDGGLHQRLAQGIPIQWINDEARRLVADPNSSWGGCVEMGLDHPNVVAVVRFEEMKKDSKATAQHALARAGYIVKATRDPVTWEQLKEFAPHFYWKGHVGGHRAMDQSIIKEFEKKNYHAMRRLRYL